MDFFRSLTSVHRPSFTSHSPHPHRRAAQFQYHNTLSGSARTIMINWSGWPTAGELLIGVFLSGLIAQAG
jgi:hypothetical protein